MEQLNISHMICNICREHGIKYYSPNLGQASILEEDIHRLDKIFNEIKEILKELNGIKSKHTNLPKFTELMNSITDLLNEVEKKISTESETLINMKKKLNRMIRSSIGSMPPIRS